MRTPSSRTLRRILLSLLAIGGAASLSVSGAYAILLSEATNSGATVASGTLTFGNRVGSGTTCYTYGGPSSPGNVNGTCAALLSGSTEYYPGDSASATVTITNNGSLPIGDLSVYMPSCAQQTTPGAGGNAGGGDPCSMITDGLGNPDGLLLSIQETSPTSYCWYPDGAPGACSSSFPQDDWFGIFAQYVNTAAAALDLGPGPAPGQSRTFAITVGLPANADPSLQGEQALFSLTWHATS